jgi:hypothetical protein
MMAQPQQQKLDPKQVGEILQGLKRQMSQVEGERTTMLEDAKSATFNNFAQILNRLFGELAQSEDRATKAEKTLEEIYSGHPDIQKSMEEKEKKEQPPKSKIVEKGK